MWNQHPVIVGASTDICKRDGCIGGQALIHQFTGRVFDVISDLCEYLVLVCGRLVKMPCDICEISEREGCHLDLSTPFARSDTGLATRLTARVKRSHSCSIERSFSSPSPVMR